MAIGALRRPLTVLLLLCALLPLGAGRAAAHAVLEREAPADGVLLRTAPTEVVLRFSEDVSVPPDAVRVLGPDGLRADDRRPGHAGGDGRTVRVGLGGRLPRGTFTVSWRVVSADGHPVSGGSSFSFGRESAAVAAPAQDTGGGPVALLYGVGRGLSYAAFCLLAGGAFLAAVCLRGPVPAPLRRLLLTAWLGLVAATVLLLVLRTPYESGGSLDAAALRATAGGRPARALLLRLALAVLLGPVLRQAEPYPAGPRRAGPSAVAALLLPAALVCGTAATWAAAEHASVGPQAALAVPLDLLHLLAAAVWLGGLAALLVLLRRAPEPAARAAGAAARFSRAAQAAVAVLAVTGAYQSWRQVGSWDALTGTGYGRLLLAKLAGVALLLAAAGYSRRWTARPARQPLRADARTAVAVAAVAARPAADARPAAADGPLGSDAPAGGPAGAPDEGPSGSDGPDAPFPEPAEAAPGTGDARRRLLRSVAAEVAVGAVVLALTTALTAAEPARTGRGSAAAAAAPAPTAFLELPFDTGAPAGRGRGKVDVVMDPGRTGDNTLQAVVLARGDAVALVPEVRVRIALPERGIGPMEVRLRRRGYVWQADDLRVPLPGRWTVTVVVRTSDTDEDTVTGRMDVPPYR
ncbi:copper resistance protein CopC [Streptacidiphilus sp. ASG 303]|uniref:copper resistance CopC family protein n=1 Tax=Streptacidiphilus sp. ASG 303 TaxID=2896847 RepID=UPI001E484E26|nr:copper resistance CopC family protein [Streptacidiphilus sp. ASG 303]MCD0483482.1 copper resistance protein CopC [Streptacidiphilus sp. ASG 303]